MDNFTQHDDTTQYITPETLKSLGRYDFPNPISVDPDGIGIVAMGGDLASETLISAYARGLFPWFNEDEPIAWWCPEPRCVIAPSDYQPSKSLRKQASRARWQLTLNQAFVPPCIHSDVSSYLKDSVADVFAHVQYRARTISSRLNADNSSKEN